MVARTALLVLVWWLGMSPQAQVVAPAQPTGATDSLAVLLPADSLEAYGIVNICRSGAPPCGDRFLAPDKVLHLGVSLLGTVTVQYILTSKGEMSEGAALPISASTVLSAGVLKELIDANRRNEPHFSWRDLTADAVGILLAIGLISL